LKPALLAALLLAAAGCDSHGPGVVEGAGLPDTVVAARAARQADVSRPATQILFGDLHVHTTYSADAFEASLPILGGEGAHPVADACDFARYCADLDFWGITDHAEFLTDRRWQETQETLESCQQRAGSRDDPDLVSFLGWEWTQIGATPESHYGHKNVILRRLEPGSAPLRPVGYDAPLEDRFTVSLDAGGVLAGMLKRPFLDPANASLYLRHLRYTADTFLGPVCPDDAAAEPTDECREVAATPDVLFRKLDAWGGEALVIPHGNSWGLYTPPGASWEKQLAPGMHDPKRQTLIEVHSGHGNSEEHRPWRAVAFDESGAAFCPAPSDDYLPCCWRAGEIIRARCDDAASPECDARVAEARANYTAAGVSGHLTVPGATAEDWLDCGQCRDCFLPGFKLRPGASAQAALATTRHDEEGAKRFRFGFIASSDNHSARPGNGYKELGRTRLTDAAGGRDAAWNERLLEPWGDPTSLRTRAPDEISVGSPHAVYETERRTSFLTTGALVAAHARGRDRDAIWEALGRREVYGTSGPRILLWFDLVNAGEEPAPMGSQVSSRRAPRFVVQALGSFRQHPGCPDHAVSGLSAERLARLCLDECHYPSDERLAITRIEVVRIRPQSEAAEPLASRIEDPWLVLPCASGESGCRVAFEDTGFPGGARDTVYYVRAIQEPTEAVNGGGLRCERDADGACLVPRPCFADYRTPTEDNCLAPVEERAWSSPIFVDFGGRAEAAISAKDP
jgi:hypothetical protein